MSTLDFHSFVILEDYAKIHKEYIISASSQPSIGEFLKWKFPNLWGASIAVTSNTQWRPELVIIKYIDDKDTQGELMHDSDITKTLRGVISQISITELVTVLAKIQGLK